MTPFRGAVAFPTIDTRAIREWSAGLRRGHQQLSRGVDSVEQVRRAVGGIWDGVASERFDATMRQRRTDVERIAATAVSACPVLDDYAAAVERATSAYERAVVAEQQARRIGIEAAPAFAEALVEQGAAALSIEAAGARCAASLAVLQADLEVSDTLDDAADAALALVDEFDSWPFPEPESVEGSVASLTAPVNAAELPWRESKWSLAGDVSVPLAAAGVSLGGDISAQITELRNGTTKVELTLTGRLAATTGSRARGAEAQLGAEGQAIRELTFASRAEADRFLTDLRDAVIPTTAELRRAGDRPALVTLDAAQDAHGVLAHYDDQVTGVRATQRAFGRGIVDLEAGPVGLGLDGRLGLAETVDTRAGTTTYSFEMTGALDVDGGVALGDGESEIKTSIETRDGRATRLVLTSDARVLVGADALEARALPSDVVGVNVQSGLREQVTVSVNLNDPSNAALARSYLGHAATRDVVGMVRTIAQLHDAGQVVVQYSGAGRLEGVFEAPADVVTGRLGTDVSTVMSTTVKEPFGLPRSHPPGR